MKRNLTGKGASLFPVTVMFFVLLLIVFLCSMNRQNCNAAWTVQSNKQVIRLHVKAAGDSPEEQQLKMLLVARLQQLFHNQKTLRTGDYDLCLSFLQEHLFVLQKELQGFADEVADSLPITVRLSQENFPLRTYGRRVYPAGSYTTLLVTVGEGDGENWWCLLFPPLCLPPAGGGDEESGPEGFLSSESKEMVNPDTKIEPKPDNTIRWRCKIWDLLKRPRQYFIEKAEQIFYN